MNGNISPSGTNQVNISLGAQIRTLRNEQNLKISDLADMTGLTSSTISQVERALISPSIASLKKICDALNIPLGYLFEDADSSNVQKPAAQEVSPKVSSADLETFVNIYPLVNLMGASPVVHKENRKILSPGKGIRFYLLNPNMSGSIEMIYNEYDPGANTGPPMYAHPGSECGLILSGELVIQIKEEIYVLKEGDSITFNSTDPHMKSNESDQMCTCIWANVPPWF